MRIYICARTHQGYVCARTDTVQIPCSLRIMNLMQPYNLGWMAHITALVNRKYKEES